MAGKDLNAQNIDVRKASSLLAVSRAIASSASPAALYETVLTTLQKETKGKRISIILKDPDSDVFVFADGRSFSKSVLKKGIVTVDENVLGWVKRNKAGIMCEDINDDSRFGKNKKLRYKSRSFISVPCMLRGRIAGFISVTERSEGIFNLYDFRLIEAVAGEFISGYSKLIEPVSDIVLPCSASQSKNIHVYHYKSGTKKTKKLSGVNAFSKISLSSGDVLVSISQLSVFKNSSKKSYSSESLTSCIGKNVKKSADDIAAAAKKDIKSFTKKDFPKDQYLQVLKF
jgi:signal transduction protein with GAF and PtsI domain